MMRVITGSARGRRLTALPGESITRPTTESVKESLFSMIQFELEDKKVLDLFAGSGQLGIEALSRGARICTFVEHNKQAMQIVKDNAEHCGFSHCSNFVLSDAVSFLSGQQTFDIAFLDPPYGKGLVERCMPLLIDNMSEQGVIVCETSKDETLPESFDKWSVDRLRRYGKTNIIIYRCVGGQKEDVLR